LAASLRPVVFSASLQVASEDRPSRCRRARKQFSFLGVDLSLSEHPDADDVRHHDAAAFILQGRMAENESHHVPAAAAGPDDMPKLQPGYGLLAMICSAAYANSASFGRERARSLGSSRTAKEGRSGNAAALLQLRSSAVAGARPCRVRGRRIRSGATAAEEDGPEALDAASVSAAALLSESGAPMARNAAARAPSPLCRRPCAATGDEGQTERHAPARRRPLAGASAKPALNAALPLQRRIRETGPTSPPRGPRGRSRYQREPEATAGRPAAPMRAVWPAALSPASPCGALITIVTLPSRCSMPSP
jgi:hypothetical protein